MSHKKRMSADRTAKNKFVLRSHLIAIVDVLTQRNPRPLTIAQMANEARVSRETINSFVDATLPRTWLIHTGDQKYLLSDAGKHGLTHHISANPPEHTGHDPVIGLLPLNS